jgi:hypothetical protein
VEQETRQVKTAKQVKTMRRSGWVAAAAALLCLGAVGCGNNVSGHTYGTAGGGVTIEFQSGGKAVTSIGPMSSQCTYTQSGKQVSLACEGDTTVFTIGDDGSLDGPPDGMLGHLTKVK